ncbi:MAG TPA: TonB-dependent receptor plug domain-containing protein, partial [Gemmatimonadaceae bacterium]|nr:TonB-dependent receptor plug domain-containing protein [Gemmatimonadaceae bacterium]
MSMLLMLTLSETAWGQQIGITGTVTSAAGPPLRGVQVHVSEGANYTVTDADGRYRITAPANGVLIFALIGQRVVREEIAGRTTIDVTMERIAFLEEVVVTAYTAQRRADITGAVASVDMEAASRQTTASVLQRLDASVPGVTVASSGSPGSRSTVRIRGVSSFQNNEPLYIVDGVPVQDSYINWLNPNDITSVQVLKDASAASIYGARASNGVIIIETRRQVTGAPRATMRVRTGIASPTRGYDDFLITDALEYHEVLRRSYVNAGQAVPTNIYGDPNNPAIPPFIWPNNCGPLAADGSPTPGVCTSLDPNSYAFPTSLIMPGSPGTNWWDAVFGTGFVGDYNLDVAGGGDETRYGVSFNYFTQDGTAAYNQFRRGSIRVNTAFDRGRLSFGENVALSHDRHTGGLPDDPGGFAEGGILGKNILMQPVVPVYDIQGNFASGKAVGLGNSTNPLKFAYEARNNESKNTRLFGNVFADFSATDRLLVRSSFG